MERTSEPPLSVADTSQNYTSPIAAYIILLEVHLLDVGHSGLKASWNLQSGSLTLDW